jgi:hypothetical protein
MSREQLNDALFSAGFILERLPELVIQEKDHALLTWKQIATETGLPMMTVWNVASRKREGHIHTAAILISWLHARTRRDPTHGRIDRDIQAYVNGMNPKDLGSRTAMEETIQAKRDRGERLAVDR